MPSLVRLRSLFLPVTISLILLIAIALYGFIWIPSRQRYLDDRNFRLLKTLSGQIKASIDNFDAMMDNAAESRITDQKLATYLKNAGLELSAVGQQDKAVIGNDYGDPPRIAVRADEGTHFLYMAFRRGNTRYGIRTDLDKLIRKLLPPEEGSPFNVILLAQSDGRVIFEKSSPGIDVTNIFELEDASGESKAGTPAQTLAKKSAFQSNLEEVLLAGARYRLYSEPLQLSVSLIKPANKGTNKTGTADDAAEWVLCGLIRADEYRLESQAVSYTHILYCTFAALLAVAVFPFLKLHVSTPTERLRRDDVISAAIFACFAASVVTFFLLDIYHWRRHFADPADADMKKLAEAIDNHFGDEKRQAFLQLGAFYEEPLPLPLCDALRIAAAKAGANICLKPKPTFTPDLKECEPPSACRQEILSGKGLPKQLDNYPHLDFVTWSDACSRQRVKWTIKKNVTPFLDLDDPSVPYYPDIKRAFTDPGALNPAPTEGVGTRYSSNTGENVTAFWKLMDVEGKPVSGKIDGNRRNRIFCASIVTRPISVIGPIIPAGYQFAVIDPSGTVVFHSDSSRNLRENFFDETDHDPSIHSRVLMRARGFVEAKYMGRPHRLYVHPMTSNQEALWSVIIFRDLRTGQTINLEMLSLASIMFLFYLAALAVVIVSVYLIYKGDKTRCWLWPDSRKAGTYRRLIVINGFAALLVLVCSQLPGLRAPLVVGLLIPAAIALVNLLTLMAGKNQYRESRWKGAYVGAYATLLAVVAVLPCFALFKVACEFEHRIFVESSQLRLASDIDARARRIRARYQDVDLGLHVGQIMAEPVEGQLFSYHDAFLTTTIGSVNKPSSTECDAGSSVDGDQVVGSFLGRLSPRYNELAANGRYLSENSCSDVWSWKSGDANELKLIRQGSGDRARVIVTSWDSRHVPWGNGVWWTGAIIIFLILLALVWQSLYRIFLLDLGEPSEIQETGSECDPTCLLATLSMNLVVLGPRSSSIICDLRQRKDVQAFDLYEWLNAPLRLAKTADGGSVNPPADPFENVMRDPRPIVLYDFDRGLEDIEVNQQKLAALERLQSKVGSRIVITSSVDPLRKAPPAKWKEWHTLLHRFVTIDLQSSSKEQAGETLSQLEARVSEDAYYRWLLSECSVAKKLALVQLAQEGLVNPHNRAVIRELLSEGLVVRRDGMIAIRDTRFAKFLESAPDAITKWEAQEASARSTVIRTSILLAGACATAFLIYTQGAVLQKWVTLGSALATSIPVFLRLFEIFRQGKTEIGAS